MADCYLALLTVNPNNVTKLKLLRYLRDDLTGAERAEVLDWIESSDENQSYFSTLKNLWTAGTLNADPAVRSDFNDLKLRIETKNKNRKSLQKRLSPLWRVAAVLAIPFGIAALWLGLTRPEPEPLVQTDNLYVTLYTPLCAKAEAILPDGTKVWLNSGSRITYPRLFEGDSRMVELDGEAYFDVTKNESYPFVVKTQFDVEVVVKGTTFNLNAYSDDLNAEVTLVSGAVEFRNGNSGQAVDLEPKQLARYSPQANDFNVEKNIDTEVFTAWKDGILIFDNVDLTEFIRKLERWYGVNITIGDTKLLDYTYTGKFKEETIRQVLELMKQTSNLDYQISEKDITLTLKTKK